MAQHNQKRKNNLKKRRALTILLAFSLFLIVAIVGTLFLVRQNPPSNVATPSSTVKSPSSTKPLVSFASLMGDRITTQPLPVVGAIAIPDVGINLPVFTGSDEKQITYGAGTVEPGTTMGQGNFSLASHHVFYINGAGGYLFSPLTKAKVGNMIYTTDLNSVYEYKIDSIFNVDVSDVSVLDPVPDKTVITLIYCVDLGGPGRTIVRGALIKKTAWADASKELQSYFTAPFNQVPTNQLSELGVNLN